ncbi:hypothetical protein OG777_16685 [Micromonospora peucetia]|uniref:Uncharacterized protein n=1 Tax=Micromonospora peucetia TaxID=47871 RepID=A0A1C6VPP5_9ACTN|nr:hypothetical protein [Micromonospora peucetia]MCX4388559.1 hypothetical protein [Micromonospora peucetia]WSA30785.1 hypothetical protein OIE14_21785 [Micromonospora peucetia]SCL68308.1 hypothetical protein GA0070608_3698 [Micromonospora peucetia]
MFFAVRETLPPGQVPPDHHVSIQRPLDAGRVVLDAAVPDDVLRDHGRLRHLPPFPEHLDDPGRHRFVLDHLSGQVDNAACYIRMSPEDLPPFVWELFTAARPVVFVWTDPTTGERVERVVAAVRRDGAAGFRTERPRRQAPGGIVDHLGGECRHREQSWEPT